MDWKFSLENLAYTLAIVNLSGALLALVLTFVFIFKAKSETRKELKKQSGFKHFKPSNLQVKPCIQMFGVF